MNERRHTGRRVGLAVAIVLVGLAVVVGAAGTAAAETVDECENDLEGLCLETTADDVTLEGDGTPDDPYRIHDVDELQAMNQNLSAHYTLANDIDASETDGWNDGDGFEPIGSGDDGVAIQIRSPEPSAEAFTGSFDGDGHTITGLTVDRPDEEFVGLFGVADGATIESVELEDTFVKGDEHVGAVAGKLSHGELRDVRSTDGYVRAYEGTYGGGLVGTLEAGTVDSSHADGEVRGSGVVIGGLVGEMSNVGFEGSVVRNSSAAADVDGGWRVGGAVGNLAGGSVVGTSAEGDVVGDEDEFAKPAAGIGGLVGTVSDGTVTASYATGDVEGTADVGGLVGLLEYGQVTETYATGTVSGEVAADSGHGGLVGTSNADVTGSYWVVENSPELTNDDGVGSGEGDGVTGLEYDELTGADATNSLDAFDFEATWTVTDSYPVLAWQTGNALTPYTDADGTVGLDGLRAAIDDWRGGELDVTVLRDAIDAWRSGEPVS